MVSSPFSTCWRITFRAKSISYVFCMYYVRHCARTNIPKSKDNPMVGFPRSFFSLFPEKKIRVILYVVASHPRYRYVIGTFF